MHISKKRTQSKVKDTWGLEVVLEELVFVYSVYVSYS